MINHPAYGTGARCWVVRFQLRNSSDNKLVWVYLRTPRSVDSAERWIGQAIVEPFLQEADAVAAALRLDGIVWVYGPPVWPGCGPVRCE